MRAATLETNTKKLPGKNVYILAFSLFALIKQIYLQNSLGIEISNIYVNIINFYLYAVIFLFFNLFIKKNYLRKNIILYIIINLFLFGDAIHYRHFHVPYSIYTFVTHRYINSISSSIIELLKFKDIFFFLDFFLIVFYMRKKTSLKKISVEKFSRNGLFFVILSIIIIIFSNTLILDDGQYSLEMLGMGNYHFYEIVDELNLANVRKINTNKIVYQNAYTSSKNGYGLAKDKNVIVIQMEAFSNYLLDLQVEGQEVMPNLNRIIAGDTICFPNYYQQIGRGNTSDAEFVSNTGFYPSKKVFSYKEYEGIKFTTIPSLLKQEGYRTMVFHGNRKDFWNRDIMYPYLGYTDYFNTENLKSDEMIGMGLSDRTVFMQASDILSETDGKFYSFIITLSSHFPYNIEERNLNLSDDLDSTIVGDYLQSMKYFDIQLGRFIEQLKDKGLYKNSVIVLYGDHYGLDARDEDIKEQISGLIGREYTREIMMKTGLYVHIPGYNQTEIVENTGGQIDFLPTMMNILGIDKNRDIIFGTDIYNDKNNIIYLQSVFPKGSFIKGNILFEAAGNGKFDFSSAYNIEKGNIVDKEKYRDFYQSGIEENNLSHYILKNRTTEKSLNKNKDIVFHDILDHWAKEEIVKMYEKGYFDKTENKEFNPDIPIKKGELLELLCRIKQYKGTEKAEIGSAYFAYWGNDYINAAIKNRIITVDEIEDNFGKNEYTHMEQGLEWIARTFEIEKNDDQLINLLKNEGIIKNRDIIEAEKEEYLNKAYAAVILYRMINKYY